MGRTGWLVLVGWVSLASLSVVHAAEETGPEGVLEKKGLTRSGKVYLLPDVEEALTRLGPGGKRPGPGGGEEPDFGPPPEPPGGFGGRRGPGRGGDGPPLPPDGGFPAMGKLPLGRMGGGPGFAPRGRRGGMDRGPKDDRASKLLDELGKLGDVELTRKVLDGTVGINQLEIRDRIELDSYVAERLLGRYDTLAADPEVQAALRMLNRGRAERRVVGPASAYKVRVVALAVETLRDRGLMVQKGTGAVAVARDEEAAAGVRELAQARKRLGELEKPPGRARPAPAEVAAQRSQFLALLRKARTAVDEAARRHEAVRDDPEVQAALVDLNGYRAQKFKHHVESATKLDRTRKELAGLEKGVELKEVPLEPDRGISWVHGVVDGSPEPLTMLVDPSAPAVRLSARQAATLGLKLDGATEVDVMGPAGRIYRAQTIRLKEVAVGPCKAEDVTCVVLPEAFGDPPAVLGASFLRRFVVEADPAARRLTLARIDLGASATDGGSSKN